jgi:hypothetical protein
VLYTAGIEPKNVNLLTFSLVWCWISNSMYSIEETNPTGSSITIVPVVPPKYLLATLSYI